MTGQIFRVVLNKEQMLLLEECITSVTFTNSSLIPIKKELIYTFHNFALEQDKGASGVMCFDAKDLGVIKASLLQSTYENKEGAAQLHRQFATIKTTAYDFT